MRKVRQLTESLWRRWFIPGAAETPAAEAARQAEEAARRAAALHTALKERDARDREARRRHVARKKEIAQLKAGLKSAKNEAVAAGIAADEARIEAAYFRELAAGRLSTPQSEAPASLDSTHRRDGWLHRRFRHLAWRREMRLGVLFQHEPRVLKPSPLPRPALPDDQLPVISIVTPSYQQAAFVERTLLSVLDQQYPKLDYIVMDGGSTDESPALIAKHAARFSHWQSERDGGHTQALAAGFARARGDVLAWLNSDDTLLPGVLRFVGEFFARHPDVDVLYGHRVLIDERDATIGRWVLPPHDADFNLWTDFLPQETMFWRRSAFDRAGGMDPYFRFAMDWDLILRLQKTGARFRRVPYFLGCFRIHEAQKSITQANTVALEENARLRHRELGPRFTPARLERRVVSFQLRAAFYDFLLRLGLRL